jgi:SpoVK/Ycf46/Vps4 family AAA+-type ATPase
MALTLLRPPGAHIRPPQCESIFEERSHGNRGVNQLLTEVERHDGIIIMATNRPFDLDEAM